MEKRGSSMLRRWPAEFIHIENSLAGSMPPWAMLRRSAGNAVVVHAPGEILALAGGVLHAGRLAAMRAACWSAARSSVGSGLSGGRP